MDFFFKMAHSGVLYILSDDGASKCRDARGNVPSPFRWACLFVLLFLFRYVSWRW